MSLPRFSRGAIGLLDHKTINRAFASIDALEALPSNDLGGSSRRQSSIVAMIAGLMPSATQGVAQGTYGTETVAGGQFLMSYLYDWREVSIGTGDGLSGTGTGVAVKDLSAARAVASNSAMIAPAGYSPAVDFAPYQRYCIGDIVLLTPVSIRTGSKYSSMYAISPTSDQSQFLARLTGKHSTIAGLYSWAGVSRNNNGTEAEKTLAVNLYELNAIRDATAYASALSVGTTSYDGSNSWGHGQSLTGAGADITKGEMPYGAAGTGSIVHMFQGPVSATLTSIAATALVVGQPYIIATTGTTDFTLAAGAARNVVGEPFIARAVATGTGTASASPIHYSFYSVAPIVSVCTP